MGMCLRICGYAILGSLIVLFGNCEVNAKDVPGNISSKKCDDQLTACVQSCGSNSEPNTDRTGSLCAGECTAKFSACTKPKAGGAATINEPGTSGKAPKPASKPPASAGTDKGPSKGAIRPVMAPPTSAGNNKESTGGGSNKSSGGRH